MSIASDEQQAGRNLADDHAHLIAVRHGELSFSFPSQAKHPARTGNAKAHLVDAMNASWDVV